VKRIERALFPGYLFACFGTDREAEIKAAPGILQVVGEVDRGQMNALRRVTTVDLPVQVVAYQPGSVVTVTTGPLIGCAGVVIRSKSGARFMVNIEILQRAVGVELDAADLVAE
jgi:transcription antitermination factor NusG